MLRTTKTSLSAAFIRILSQRFPDKKILAVDADPAVGLSTALGIEVETTVDDIRKEIVSTGRLVACEYFGRKLKGYEPKTNGLQDKDGKEISLADYFGRKIVRQNPT